MFATGIENSIPTINHGKTRIDEMEVCGHYQRWREDFDCVAEVGINYLRYGPPIHKTYLGPHKYDWEFADLTFAELKRRDITPIVDLCHFGVPDWLGNFQNPDFPRLFAAYAGEFAERFPWVQLYTPINAIFIQSESSEYYHADSPAAIGRAEVLNQMRFISLDLNYGRRVDSGMYQFLMDNGMSREDYEWFLEHRLKQHCILGNDYYQLNEHRVFADGHTVAAGETFGYSEITRQYYNRYRLPVMHTETNLWEGPHGDEAVKWLWKEWDNVLRWRNVGIPLVGFTWYSLTD